VQKNNSKIKIIVFAFGFMGNPVFENLSKNKLFDIKGIILPKNDPLYFSNINKKNIKQNIKILHSDKKNKVHEFIKKLSPDIVLISTFNKILDRKTLNLCKFLNIHHGKLPHQKGRASINWAIVMGRKEIYITIHEVVPKLDSGKILYQKKISIGKFENYEKIQNKIYKFIKKNIGSLIQNYLKGKFILKNNNSSNETWNCSRNPEDGMINFYEKRKDVFNLIRSSDSGKFGAFFFLKEKKITILDANINSKKKFEGIIPGRVVKLNKDGSVDCLCADGILTITKISYNNKIIKPAKIIKSTRCTLLND
jgi:methionyl-tRNA formyltransferase